MTPPMGMATDRSFELLAARLRAGDDQAAADVFRRYAERLVRLATLRLDARLKPKVDPEDIVQSALRSFFVRQGRGQFELTDWNALWSLLVLLTIRKCIRRAEHLMAARRDVRDEQSPPAGQSAWEFLDREPRPEESLTMEETLDELLRPLESRGREIVSLSLLGYTTEEISERLGCSRRTVQRELLLVRRRLEQMRDD